MSDEGRTKEHLLSELAALRSRVAELEGLQRIREMEYKAGSCIAAPVPEQRSAAPLALPSGEERTWAEDALRASEARFRIVAECASDLVYEWDLSNDLLQWYGDVDGVLGYEPGESPRTFEAWESALHPDDHDRVMNAVKRHILDHELFRVEYRMRRKDGTYLCWAERGTALWDDEGVPYKWIGVMRDVTERKLGEEERMRLAKALEHAAEMIIITDPNGMILYVNPGFERTTGYAREEVIGCDIQAIECGLQGKNGYGLNRDGLARMETWTGHLVNRKKDGSAYEVEATISPIFDEHGSIINYVSVQRDVTQEVLMERQLRETEKMNAIGTLAGGIAHDFNNILGVIMGYTDIALLHAQNGEIFSQSLSQVINACRRAKDLVKQILTFSRQTEHERTSIMISPIIKETLKLLRASLPSTIEIRQRMDADTAVILADETQIHQIFMNLCTNAAHAMRQRGGLLDIILQTVSFSPGDALPHPDLTPGSYVHLAVKDTGHGMDHHVLERIFEPYFTTKEKGEGTGLGLSIVHGIVKSYKGTIMVTSEPGIGATFEVFIPRIEAREERPQEAPQQFPKGNERILIVDDEALLVDVCQQMLEFLGYEVTGVTSSNEALRIFRNDPKGFDLVIADQTMPQMTGAMLAMKLFAIRPEFPVILCTGYSESISEEEARGLGIRRLMFKPLEMEGLATTVRQVLDEKGSGREKDRNPEFVVTLQWSSERSSKE